MDAVRLFYELGTNFTVGEGDAEQEGGCGRACPVVIYQGLGDGVGVAGFHTTGILANVEGERGGRKFRIYVATAVVRYVSAGSPASGAQYVDSRKSAPRHCEMSLSGAFCSF